jgi:hypothetical protein
MTAKGIRGLNALEMQEVRGRDDRYPLAGRVCLHSRTCLFEAI